ncbi:hypothetical protein [Solibacillus daqui]|uniref:hypothetical protein n=1 Tax=Solibacillus daqui TaxID=2912187 RepID=UPI0023660530|nr:hypothetical protein [Solibacillus daqui]
MGEGLVIGMDNKIQQVVNAGKRMASAVTQPMDVMGMGNRGSYTNSSVNNSKSYSGQTTINVYGNNPSPSEIARKATQAQRQLAMEWGV